MAKSYTPCARIWHIMHMALSLPTSYYTVHTHISCCYEYCTVHYSGTKNHLTLFDRKSWEMWLHVQYWYIISATLHMSTSVPVSSGTPTMSSTSQRAHSWDGAKMEGSMCTQYSTDVSEIIIFNSHSVPKYERAQALIQSIRFYSNLDLVIRNLLSRK